MVLRDEDLRRSLSAGHYLLGDALASRLRPTMSLTARVLGFSTAMVNILDEQTQHTIIGLGSEGVLTTPREEAFCDVVVRTGEPLVVRDATADPRFARFPSVVSGQVTTYVGVPLIGRESLPVGVICVVDAAQQPVTDDQVARLMEFGQVVEDQLDLIRRLAQQRGQGTVLTGPLSAAISDGEILPWYQPIVHLQTGRTVGFEALARWVHPSGEVDDPGIFVPIAGDSDLIIDLDLSVMRQALRQLCCWQRSDPDLRMSVNLSSRHFERGDASVQAVVDAAARRASVAHR